MLGPDSTPMSQPNIPNAGYPSNLSLQILPLKAGLPLGQPHKTKALIRLISSQPLPSSVNELSLIHI